MLRTVPLYAPPQLRGWTPGPVPYRANLAVRPRLHAIGQAAPSAAAGAALGLLDTGLGAATSYVGFHTAVAERGFLSILGWIVGITGGLYALSSLAGTVVLVAGGAAQRTTTPV